MSTGYRINNASDDAAGLVISKALKVQENGLQVANENAQMATNILNVADGALSKMTDLTLRIRDLALQAANGGYSYTERSALQQEVNQLAQNMEQLVNGTKFNDFQVFGEQEHSNIIRVGTAKELYKVMQDESVFDENASIMLTADIDLDELGDVDGNGSNWISVGSDSMAFVGVFDGNGFTIKNLKINNTDTACTGFFGNAKYATIKNVSIENAKVVGAEYTGALAGYASYGKITNCSMTGEVSGSVENAGGLLGCAQFASITDCSAKASVEGAEIVGGLLGNGIYSNLTNCKSESEVQAGNFAGGLVGIAEYGTVTNSYFKGTVDAAQYVGGLVGRAEYGTVTNCYSQGNIKGTRYTGGLGGDMAYANIVNSYSSADVERKSGTSDRFGAFVGHGYNSVISSCYSTGQLLTDNITSYGGGFIGYYSGATLTNCNYIEQNVSTYNVDITGLTKQNEDWFKNSLNWENINTGSADSNLNNYWDLTSVSSTSAPTLNFLNTEPIEVSTAEELAQVLTSSNALNNANFSIILTEDIDLNDLAGKTINGITYTEDNNWVAIGTSGANNFCGTFDGNGHTIKNLKINKSGTNNQGLFGYATSATIKNLTLDGADINGGENTGGLAGVASGATVKNCCVNGNIVGTTNVGGLIGTGDWVNVDNSYSEGTVGGTANVGGLIGFCESATAEYCFSTADISRTSGTGEYFGGLFGNGDGLYLYSCYYNGQISTEGIANNVGAILGGGVDASGDNFFYVEQINGYDADSEVQRDEAWFCDRDNLKSVLGENSIWDYSDYKNGIVKFKTSKLSELVFQIGADGSNLSSIKVDTGFSLEGFAINITNMDYAREAITKCDELLRQLNKKRAEIGASANIMQSITQGNSITKENLSASNSRVVDADIARESANMVKNQILQNTATALLSQSQAMDGGLLLRLLGM